MPHHLTRHLPYKFPCHCPNQHIQVILWGPLEILLTYIIIFKERVFLINIYLHISIHILCVGEDLYLHISNFYLHIYD